jgi:hypothetical protein
VCACSPRHKNNPKGATANITPLVTPKPPPTKKQSGKYEPGLGNNYGYYGSPTAAAYFGAGYPSQSELALARMNPSASSLQSRLYARNARYNSLYPYDF